MAEYKSIFTGAEIDDLLSKARSSEKFTSAEKAKLAGLSNYDDSEIKGDISDNEAAINSHTANTSNPHGVTKAQIGLGNVDNTSDANKPISTAQQAALNNKVDKVTGKGLSTNDFTDSEKAQITTNKNGVAAVANNGAKNRLNTYLATVKPFNTAGTWSDNVYTHNGVTFTVNEDGSLTINGTSTGSGSDFVFSRNAGTSFGGLVLTGSLTSDSGDAGISIVCRQQNDAEIGRSRNGQPYTIPMDGNVGKIVIHLVAGEKETNRTMYPLIRDAAIEDDTFVPYAPTNRELYEMILALQSGNSANSLRSSELLSINNVDDTEEKE